MAEPSPPSPAQPQSDAEKEEMLDRMLTRLALADDSNLQPLLAKILPYSISSLASPSVSIRKLVMEILSHVNKRVKLRLDIGLPLLVLWKLYREDSATSIVRNFCIVYIEMAFERLTVEEKVDLAPELITDISNLPAQHQGIILRIISKVVGECHSTKTLEDIGKQYKNVGSVKDRELFVGFCLHVILYQPPSQGINCPPGLSVFQADRVTGKLPLHGDSLLMRKIGILNVIDAMDVDLVLVYPLYIAASSDSQELVARKAEELLKRKAFLVNLENPDLVSKLFLLFNGTAGIENISAEYRVMPGSFALRLRLMSIFCRSVAAANAFPSTLQCIFGCIYGTGTTPRLKQLGMEFTVWVFKHAVLDQLKLMGPIILNGILRSLDIDPNNDSEANARDVKTFAYQAIGLLALRLPQLFREKVDMALRLFKSLKMEDQSILLTVQEATISLAMAYKDAPIAVLRELETLLLENSNVEQSEVRFCAVRWATSLYHQEHCPSRFICMIAAADSRLDTRELAVDGLSLMARHVQNSDAKIEPKFPRLGDMLDYICKQQPRLVESAGTREEKLIFPSKMYSAMIDFLMKCYDSDSELDDNSSKFDLCSSVATLCNLLEYAMAYEGSSELHATACRALVTVGSRLPELVASRYAERISWLKQLLNHVDSSVRESASRLLGVTCAALSPSTSSSLVNELLSFISGAKALRFESHHGALSAIGYIVAEYTKENAANSDTLLQNVVNFLIPIVESESASLASIAMEALGHIGLRCQLPMLNHNLTSVGILNFLQERLQKLLSGDDIKAVQKIAISLGHICARETSFSHTNIALDLIFTLCRSKVEDVLFACGEALSFIWGGVPVTADVVLKSNYISLSQTSNFLAGGVLSTTMTSDSSVTDANEECGAMAREVIIRKLFDSLLCSSRKEERCAGTVWLVSLIMYCGYHHKIQQLLPDIQEAFSHLLGEQNELTQELASQGMSIVYELGDTSMKQDLVNALVGTLTGSGKRKRAVKVVEDTEIFQEGAIDKNVSGGKLGTYKELCNLANEMGQPDLIYRFMDLANYQASLNSKRGAAYGFSKIAKLAGDAIRPHLSSLVPRLVRYQYDPDKNVQDAMGHIWKSIVDDPRKTIDEYFDLIVDDLLVQSGSRLWRSREASCYALADLIQGRKCSQVLTHLKRIWVTAFRAMDDIKETVRNSGDSLCRAVSTLTTRLCDVSLTPLSDSVETMNIVLPFLLVEGIVSKVSSIQKASLAMVMKLSKSAGIALRPHLSNLVCCMLESLSSLEDQRLNYVELHAANAGIQMDKLESLRISVAKDSPMWDTLDLCLKVIDVKSMELLIPRLAQLVRSGVGLNTRVGVANFITLLVQKVNADIKPFTSLLLKLLFQAALEEKGAAAKKAFAAACSVTFKYAAPLQAQNLIEQTAALHLGDKNSQVSCAILLKNYISFAADVVSGYHATVIPVAFISRFEDDKDVSNIFDELWEESAGNERISLQLYASEMVSLLCECLGSSSWSSKKKSAKAIRNLCEILGDSLVPFQHGLLDSLLKELPGRLWEGKESLLSAVASLCSFNKTIFVKDAAISDAITSVILSACTKKNKTYRDSGFSCLQEVVKAMENPKSFKSVFPFLLDVCNQTVSINNVTLIPTCSTEKTDENTREDVTAPLDKVLDCIASSIMVAHFQDILLQRENIIHVFLHGLSAGLAWMVKASTISSIRALCSKCRQDSNSILAFPHEGCLLLFELFQSVAPRIIECISTVKISQIHVSASECLLTITELYNKVPSAKRKGAEFKDEVIHLHEVEKNAEAKTLLGRCVTLIESLALEQEIM